MKYFLIMNPGSRGGKSRRNFAKIRAFLAKHNKEYQCRTTKFLADAYAFSVEANTQGYDVIVAVGGDGTINRVINGFYDSSGTRRSSAKLAVIYTGTSPDFCKSYHIPIKIDQALEVLLTGKSKKIRIGKVTYAGNFVEKLAGQPVSAADNTKTSYFACCANIGLGATLARKANSGIRKYLGDFLGTFISLLQTLTQYKPSDFVMEWDGRRKELRKVFNLSVGKTPYIASGIKVKNDLTPKDEKFYTLIVKSMSLLDIPGVFKKIYGGKEFTNSEIISLEYVGSLEIYGNSNNPELEFDGDPRGFLPCLLETVQDPLDVICGVQDE